MLVLMIAPHLEIHARLDSLLQIVDGNRGDAVNFHDFQRMVEGHLLSHSIKGVYFVSITQRRRRLFVHACRETVGGSQIFLLKKADPTFREVSKRIRERNGTRQLCSGY